MKKCSKALVGLGIMMLVLFCMIAPNTSGIIWGSFPPLPYWHGGIGNHTVWTDTNYSNVKASNNMNASHFFGNGSTLTFFNILMGGKLTSTLAVGTSPFAVTSTTLNTNLNSDFLDGYHAGSLENNGIMRYNSTGTKMETGTVAESAGALSKITTLAMSGVLTNTKAIGTAPFTITSTTKVSNLNVDYVDGLHVATSGSAIPSMSATNTWSGFQSFTHTSGLSVAYALVCGSLSSAGSITTSMVTPIIVLQDKASGHDHIYKFEVYKDSFSIIDMTASATRFIIDTTGHIGIGTAPATSAQLDIYSTDGALIVPRMSESERDALTAVDGMIILNTDTRAFNFYESGRWYEKRNV